MLCQRWHKHTTQLNKIDPYSVGTDFGRQILTSKVDPRAEWLKYL